MKRKGKGEGRNDEVEAIRSEEAKQRQMID
jgi:hypothetical protein